MDAVGKKRNARPILMWKKVVGWHVREKGSRSRILCIKRENTCCQPYKKVELFWVLNVVVVVVVVVVEEDIGQMIEISGMRIWNKLDR